MEKLFKLQENGTTVKTELLAGLTTFMTMAYIIALNPNLLTNFAVGTAAVERCVPGDLHRLRHRHHLHGLHGQQALRYGSPAWV